MANLLNLKLIPKFDRINANQSIEEWIEKVELICNLCREIKVKQVVQFQISDGTFAIYHQLIKEEKGNVDCIKNALYTEFMTNSWHTNNLMQIIGLFLAVLHKLVVLFSKMTESGLAYIIMVG